MDEALYNRHYITVDPAGRITDGWSDGPHRGRETAGAVLLTDRGGYQFRLIYSAGFVGDDAEVPSLRVSEENPPLYTEDGVPLYRWENGVAIKRTDEEIAAERPDPVELEEIDMRAEFIVLQQQAADADAMNVDQELRLTLLELGLFE